MTREQLTYLVFGGLLILALVFDLGLLSKKRSHVTIKKAIFQTIFWVGLAFSFFVFLWMRNGHNVALEYISAYLMEWSLSIDNIFVFILIFTFFGVKDVYSARILLVGILMAIVFRIIFITVGIALVERFAWVLYIFGGILVYSGVRIFSAKSDEMVDIEKNRVYSVMKRFLPLTSQDNTGKLTVKIDNKRYFTTVFVVIVMLATTDVVFALDSIPAVFAIVTNHSQRDMIIYTSNIFAVLGLRSLFFLLQGAVSKFAHLQQGIAIVLIFVGVKMLLEHVIKVPVYISLIVILVCISASIIYSISTAENNNGPDTNLPDKSE
jgi:TerC family integral membrane protein